MHYYNALQNLASTHNVKNIAINLTSRWILGSFESHIVFFKLNSTFLQLTYIWRWMNQNEWITMNQNNAMEAETWVFAQHEGGKHRHQQAPECQSSGYTITRERRCSVFIETKSETFWIVWPPWLSKECYNWWSNEGKWVWT